MSKNEIEILILKERYKTLSTLESECPRISTSKVAKKIDKMMRDTIIELAKLQNS